MCAGTFRLAKADVNEFIDALVDGLRDAAPTPVLSSQPPRPREHASPPRPTAAERPSPADWLFGDDHPGRATA
jgi:hypothetical protein